MNFAYVYLYFATLPVFLICDALWIGFFARSFYAEHLGYLMRESIQWGVALAFYLVFLIGLLFFAIIPALQEGSVMKAFLYGAFLGFLAYATYDLTNQATIKDWPVIVTLVDIAWGTVVCGLVAAVSYTIGKNLLSL